MSSLAIKYTLLSSTLAAAAPPAYSSAFSDTAALTDGLPQDTATFVTGNPSNSLVAYFKFPTGTFSTTDTINCSTELVSSGWSSVYAWASSDGTNWGTYSAAYNNTGGSGSPSNVVASGSTAGNGSVNPSLYQYIAVVFNPAGSVAAQVSDIRITGNSSGNTLGPVAVLPTAPAAPSFGATTTGVNSLPINTQALTAGATSENIQISADSTFQAGVTNIAVPTPGTAVTATGLTSQTVYYSRVQMIGGGGTTNGPSLSVGFDVTGPTFPAGSVSINAAGTVLTLLATEFSPPVTNLAAGGVTLSLSGGPVTLSGFAIQGKSITATLSRIVMGPETGSVSIPAGAFGDTAVPTANSSLAVSGLAIINNSTQNTPAPTAPAAPGVVSVAAYSAILSIPALTANALTFNLQFALDAGGVPGNWNTVGTVVTPSSNVVVNGLPAGSGGYFRLVAVGPGGSTNGASTAKVTTLMATERGTLFQGIQIGVEATPGTIVPATKRLISLQTDPDVIVPVKTYRPFGNKSYTETQSGQEMTESAFTGILDFNTIIYLLASQIGIPPAPTALTGGAFQWNFNLSETLPAMPQTYSCEIGGAQGASKFGYGYVPDLDLTFAKEEAAVSGKFQGQIIQDNITLTPAVPELPAIAMPPKLVRLSLGTTSGSLTKLTRVISAKVTMNGHFVPSFFRDDGQPSFTNIVEKAPDYMFQIVNETGSDTDTLLAGLRTDTIFYLQAQVTGNLIATGVYYLFNITMPVKVNKQPTREDHDGIYGATYDFVGAHDPVFGAVQASVVNKLASL